DGKTALDRVHNARPDAILLDLMMPGMNGRQFLQTLRDEPAYATIPVMIMTAVHGLEISAALGPLEVVEKPFNVDELLNKVARSSTPPTSTWSASSSASARAERSLRPLRRDHDLDPAVDRAVLFRQRRVLAERERGEPRWLELRDVLEVVDHGERAQRRELPV